MITVLHVLCPIPPAICVLRTMDIYIYDGGIQRTCRTWLYICPGGVGVFALLRDKLISNLSRIMTESAEVQTAEIWPRGLILPNCQNCLTTAPQYCPTVVLGVSWIDRIHNSNNLYMLKAFLAFGRRYLKEKMSPPCTCDLRLTPKLVAFY